MTTHSFSAAIRRPPTREGRVLSGIAFASAVSTLCFPSLAPAAAAVSLAALAVFVRRLPSFSKEAAPRPGALRLGHVGTRRDGSAGFLRRLGLGLEPFFLERDALEAGVVVRGTTGSGKGELLLGLADATIAQGGGVLYLDGKGDVAGLDRLLAIAARHGREDDVRILDLMPCVGARALLDAADHPLSHTYDPFASADDEEAPGLMSSIVLAYARGTSKGYGDPGTIAPFLEAYVPYVRWLSERDPSVSFLGAFRDNMSVDAVTRAVDRDGAAPTDVRERLERYLASLPGYVAERGARQSQTTCDAFGYVVMQCTKAVGRFVDHYPHVFGSGKPEIDLRTVLDGRLVLYVMLPALEKGSDDMSLLFDVVAEPLVGILDRSAKRAPATSPFLVVDDEASAHASRPEFVGRIAGKSVGVVSAAQQGDVAVDAARIGAAIALRCEGRETADVRSMFHQAGWGRLRDLRPGECLVGTSAGIVPVAFPVAYRPPRDERPSGLVPSSRRPRPLPLVAVPKEILS